VQVVSTRLGSVTSRTGWLLRLGAVALVFGALTLWRSHELGIAVRDPGGQYLVGKILTSAGVFVALAVVDALARTPRPTWSLRGLLTTARTRWTGRRLGAAWAALLCYHLIYFCYHNLKSWDVLNPPRDAMLVRVDHVLFLGHHPAVLLHDLLGQGVSAWVLIVIYESFPILVTVAIVAPVVFADRVRDGAVMTASLCWAWVLGTASYYAIPSLGPFHERPQDFAGLPTSIVTRTQAQYLAERNDFLADPMAHGAFAQISAFASLHVAITTVILLMAAYFGRRRTIIALAFFLVGTLLATVYLGWHFAVDDVAGLAIGWLAVLLGRLTINPSRSELRAAVTSFSAPVPPASSSSTIDVDSTVVAERRFTIVSFHAHPDDEALLTSGTLARAAADGHRVVIVVATSGEAGLAREDWATSDLGARRQAELEESARTIGATRVEVLGHPDSGWPVSATDTTSASDPVPFSRLDVEPLAHDLAALLAQEAADVLTIYDEHGGYGHPDHVQVHRVGVRAAQISGTPVVLEATVDRVLITRAIRVLRHLARFVPMPDLPDTSTAYTSRADLTHRVDVRHHLCAKERAMGAHVSQSTDGDGGDVRTIALILRLPRPLRRRALRYEWFRERTAAWPGRPVDDIFASIRPDAGERQRAVGETSSSRPTTE
jgi:LmbE family N-acetylglucosaminyl deacetylase/membrane-associated phospholipid phosphatase